MKPTPLPLLVPLALLLSSAEAQPPSPAATAETGWQQSQRRDNADAYTFTRYTLIGAFLTSAPIAEYPQLRVDCIPAAGSRRPRFLTANLLVGTTLKIAYVEPEEIRGIQYFPKVAVRFRLDARAEEQEQWPAGTDRVPTARPSDRTAATIPKDTLKRILRAHTVTIIADDERGKTLEMRFDLPDSTGVRNACPVEE